MNDFMRDYNKKLDDIEVFIDDMEAEEEFEEVELKTFAMEYADGSKADCAIIAEFNIEFEDTGRSQDYCAVVELDKNGNLPDELEVMLFRYYGDPLTEENFRLGDIESDEEKEIVQSTFEQIMEDEEE